MNNLSPAKMINKKQHKKIMIDCGLFMGCKKNLFWQMLLYRVVNREQ